MSDFNELMDSLSRTMRGEEIRKAIERPLPRPFRFRWHPVIGCRMKSSPVCNDCVARKESWEEFQKSTAGYWPAKPTEVTFHEPQLTEPIRYREPMDIEVAPLSDLFQPDVSDEIRHKIFSVIKNSPQHRFFVLTKNPAFMKHYFKNRTTLEWPLPNVWVGTSVEDQASYNARVPNLLGTPASNHFLVFEPLLGPISLDSIQLDTHDRLWPFKQIVQAYEAMDDQGQRHWAPLHGEPLMRTPAIKWIYIGGARGDAAKPPHPSWVQKIVQHTSDLHIPVWFAGFGEYAQVEKPDLESDETLVYVNQNGEYRGRGVGSATNQLAQTWAGETSALLSRKTVPGRRMLLNGKHYLERAPFPVKLAPEHQDSMQALAQRLKKSSV
jgi:protein gp37